jgi:hypothetical protein
MDEIDALNTRIEILESCQFECLGPVKDLIKNYSKGFTLIIKTGSIDENEEKDLKEFIVRKFLDVEFEGKYAGSLIFHLTDINTKYSEIFKKLSDIKNYYKIMDFTVTAMSLEQVFINFSKLMTKFTKREAEEEQNWREQEKALQIKIKNSKADDQDLTGIWRDYRKPTDADTAKVYPKLEAFKVENENEKSRRNYENRREFFKSMC